MRRAFATIFFWPFTLSQGVGPFGLLRRICYALPFLAILLAGGLRSKSTGLLGPLRSLYVAYLVVHVITALQSQDVLALLPVSFLFVASAVNSILVRFKQGGELASKARLSSCEIDKSTT